MEQPIHTMNGLFAQLGLSNDESSIQTFIDQHRPLPQGVELHEAAFWSPAQAQFLQQAKAEDADWAVPVDELSVSLR